MSRPKKPPSAADLNDPGARRPGGLGGENARGEPAGCPTGLAGTEPVIVAQPPGGGVSPGADPSVPLSPGEGVTEEQAEKAGDEV